MPLRGRPAASVSIFCSLSRWDQASLRLFVSVDPCLIDQRLDYLTDAPPDSILPNLSRLETLGESVDLIEELLVVGAFVTQIALEAIDGSGLADPSRVLLWSGNAPPLNPLRKRRRSV